MVLIVLLSTDVKCVKSDTDCKTGHVPKISFSSFLVALELFSVPRSLEAKNFIFPLDSPCQGLLNDAIKFNLWWAWVGVKNGKT